MHVGAVLIFEGEAPGYDELVEVIEARLDRLPRYRQRVAWPAGPLLRPCWVDDPRFDASFHVRHAALPQPRGERELRELAGRLFGEPLDREKPLWEVHLVDEVRGGRFALIAKLHHALADGISGVDIATLLLDVEADAPQPEAAGWQAPPPPSRAALLAEETVEQAREGLGALRRALARPREVIDAAARAARTAPELLGGARPSRYNDAIGPHRSFVWTRVSLFQVAAIRERFGVTVNDVVLAAVAGALRRHLGRQGPVPQSLTAMVPVSTRPTEQRGALGNQISSLYTPLPVGLADPVQRLTAVADAVGTRKQSGQADAVAAISAAGDVTPQPLMALVARQMTSPRMFNVTVTNIPGPPFRLYLLGRPLDDVFPLVPLARDHALGIAVMSYEGRLDFGLLACSDSIDDLDDLARDLRVSMEELAGAAAQSRRRAGKRFSQTPRPVPSPRHPSAVH